MLRKIFWNKGLEAKYFGQRSWRRSPGGGRAPKPTCFLDWQNPRAWFDCALSISSVKVVRHRNSVWSCGGMWKTKLGDEASGVPTGRRLNSWGSFPGVETPGYFRARLRRFDSPKPTHASQKQRDMGHPRPSTGSGEAMGRRTIFSFAALTLVILSGALCREGSV